MNPEYWHLSSFPQLEAKEERIRHQMLGSNTGSFQEKDLEEVILATNNSNDGWEFREKSQTRTKLGKTDLRNKNVMLLATLYSPCLEYVSIYVFKYFLQLLKMFLLKQIPTFFQPLKVKNEVYRKAKIRDTLLKINWWS